MTFLTSLAIIFLSAILLGSICQKIKLPPLLAMLIIGVVLGPYVLNIIAPTILNISSDIRQFALVIILTRAGLSLNINELRKNGRSAILLCFLPALFEIIGYIIFATLILNLSILNAALLGSVMAAVSPAVVIPRMLKIKENGYGTEKGIPQLIIAGASIDDVFVIVVFTALLSMTLGEGFSWNIIWQVPVSIILGILVGIIAGLVFQFLFKRVHIRDSLKVLILLSFSFLFIALEQAIGEWIPYAGLLSIISMGAVLFMACKPCADRLGIKYNKIWLVAEILLFVLVGAAVNIKFALSSFGLIIAVIGLAMIFRMAGVYISLLGSKFNIKEKLFCMIAYTPKATVQAAIGAIPLSLGVVSGEIILSAAAISILITAPFGAFITDITYKHLLKQ